MLPGRVEASGREWCGSRRPRVQGRRRLSGAAAYGNFGFLPEGANPLIAGVALDDVSFDLVFT